MNVKSVAIDSLEVPKYCNRKHTQEQIDRFVKHYHKNKQYQPIVVAGNEVLCGVLVWEGMKQAGETEITVNDLGDISEEKRKEIRYLDNQIFDIEDWDELRIKDFLMNLDSNALDDFGFTVEETELYINEIPDGFPVSPKSKQLSDVYECLECGWYGTL